MSSNAVTFHTLYHDREEAVTACQIAGGCVSIAIEPYTMGDKMDLNEAAKSLRGITWAFGTDVRPCDTCKEPLSVNFNDYSFCRWCQIAVQNQLRGDE